MFLIVIGDAISALISGYDSIILFDNFTALDLISVIFLIGFIGIFVFSFFCVSEK